jgi:D-tyrosyl-tRNA(Tyr) deacylase
MRIVVQRVLKCAVHVEERLVSEIDKGVLALIGFERGDDASVLDFGVKRVVATRYLTTRRRVKSRGRHRRRRQTTGHSVMLVSQFTLFGEPVKGKGNRLDFHRAMAGPEAKVLFDEFVRRVEKQMLAAGATGRFGVASLARRCVLHLRTTVRARSSLKSAPRKPRRRILWVAGQTFSIYRAPPNRCEILKFWS